ncbi:MAG: hypothetical protein VCD00_19420 [Candidatus Hydrogenedentota bacterium]
MKLKTSFGLIIVAALAGAFALPAATEVTFTKDVLPILQENCQDCHRPSGRNMSGMIAPMSFMTYQEARPWAKAIARAVSEKIMPPWRASDATHGVFKNERTLTQDQIDTIVSWVAQRAPRGNPKDAPEPVTFPEGWYMGEPDLVISFPKPFFVPDDAQDLYHNVSFKMTKEQLPEDEWVRGLEFMPGSEAVHHVIAYTRAEGTDDHPGRRTHLGGLAPGTDDADYPEGYGKPLYADSTFTFAMHYHKEAGPGTGQWDNTSVAVKFHDQPVTHEITTSPVAHGAFEIPPNHGHWKVGGARTFDEDIDLLGLMPHTHLRGVHAKYTAYYPDGTSELLLEVPRYDFNWQTSYTFKDIKKIPAGTRVEWEIIYDNSPENAASNGFNSDRPVSFGRPTTDEMDLGWMTYAPSAGNVDMATVGDD